MAGHAVAAPLGDAERRADLRALGHRIARDLYRVPGVIEVFPPKAARPVGVQAEVRLTDLRVRVDAEVDIGVAGLPADDVAQAVARRIRSELRDAGRTAGHVRVRIVLIELSPKP